MTDDTLFTVRGAVRGRAGLRRSAGILDAAVSSLGNLAIGVAAARNLPLVDFGYVSTTMLTAIVLLGIGRAVWGDPLTLMHSADDIKARQEAVRDALTSYTTSALLVPPVVFVLLTLILRIVGAPPGTAFSLGLTLAVGFPFLAIQDLLRQAGYCLGRPLVAFANSAAWTLLLVVLMLLALWLAPPSRPLFVGLWAGSAVGGIAVGALLLKRRPRLGNPLPWARAHSRITRSLLLDYGLTQVTAEASIVIIAMVAGAAEAGVIRKAQIPLAPLIIMTTGIISVAQPALVRRVAEGASPATIRRLVYALGAAAMAIAVMFGLLVWGIPESVMRHLVGSDWEQARPLVIVLSVYLGLGAVGGCQGIALRALGQLGRQVRYRLLLSPVLVSLVTVGAVRGASTAALALCAGLLLVNLVWSHLLWRPHSQSAGGLRV